jgi:hypothetical protein
MATRMGLNQSGAVRSLQSTTELRTRTSAWLCALLLVSSVLVLRSPVSADGGVDTKHSQARVTVTRSATATILPTAATPSVTTTTTPTATPGPTPQQVGATQTFFGSLGFLFGFFLVYSITLGSKTQDVFKSFLGIAGLGSGILETKVFPEGVQLDGITAYGVGAVLGFGLYVLIAAVLCRVYAVYYVRTDPTTVPPESGWALFAAALARTVLGEELRPPASTK